MELGVVIGKTGRDIPQDEAEYHIAGYGKSKDYSDIVSLAYGPCCVHCFEGPLHSWAAIVFYSITRQLDTARITT